MACHTIRGRLSAQVRRSGQQLISGDQTGPGQLLAPDRVQTAIDAEGIRVVDCLFTPLVTLWTFLAQVLGPDRSCRAALAKLVAWLGATRAEGADEDLPYDAVTGPYCKARQRLPERLVARLTRESGRDLHKKHPAGWLLGGRVVKVVDGTTVSMPDTAENQKAYPQPSTAKPGLGFPLMRVVAVMSLHCSAMLDVAFGPYAGKQCGETALFRTLLHRMEDGSLVTGDVLLADRYYASFWMIAMLLGRGVDSVMRQHQFRKADFRRGTRLGKDDHLIVLDKPVLKPQWMEQDPYDALPKQITVREVRVRVAVKGFRVKCMVLVTTLLDAEQYGRQEIAKAFRLRWHVELDLRSIKQTMEMSVLRCKTPAMVRKEVWMHLLAYNLIRGLMARAAGQAGVEPRELSFAGALQTITAFAPAMQLADPGDLPHLEQILLQAIARHRVGDRPNRYEPRAVKRRSKPIALLTVPRSKARRQLERGVSAKG